MATTVPHYPLEPARDAAHGGNGWLSRAGTTADELGSIWSACGVISECGILRAARMHRPGLQTQGITDAALARAGVPILRSILGSATFKGADVAVVSEDLVFVTEGQRANREEARQVAQAFIYRIYELLKGRYGMAINMVPLAPGMVIMPAGNPVTRANLDANAVTCLEVEVDEPTKGVGSVHCVTGVVHRKAA